MAGPDLMPEGDRARALAEGAMQLRRSFVSAGLDLVSAQGTRHWGVGKNATAVQK
jgi:dihydroxyacetone kinase DhaKLM complex PTS-EIIA-like component DhaM